MAQHGTIYMYRDKKCRCDDCRAAKAAKSRAERSAKRPVVPGDLIAHLEACGMAGSRTSLQYLRDNYALTPAMVVAGRLYWDPAQILKALDRRRSDRAPKQCMEEGCEDAAVSRDRCYSHYRRYFHNVLGNPRTNKSRAERRAARESVRVAAGKFPRPAISSPYRLLARTCPQCGDLVTTPDNLIRKDAGRKINRCPRCAVAASTAYQKQRWETDEDYRLRIRANRREANGRALDRYQRQTRESAMRNGQEWTGPELEILSRTDLTTRQMALMLGRTYAAVSHAKHRLRYDPRFDHLAGVSTASHDD